jgi:hypothetical protein
MGIKKGDLIDEHKRHPDSCGLVVKVMGGGEGFERILCCDHELTAADVVSAMGSSKGRKRGQLPAAIVLDEKTFYPDSCGLRVMIMDGGAGFKEILCCGHSLTLTSKREMKYDLLRGSDPEHTPKGNA